MAGLVLYGISPSAPIVSPETAQKFLWPSELRPEPGEQLIYLGLLLTTPGLLVLSVTAARRWFPSASCRRADRHNQPDAREPSMTRLASLPCLMACAVAALVPLGYLPFGAAAIHDGARPGFANHWDAVFYSVVQISRGETCLASVKPQYGCYGEFLRPIFSIVGLSVARASVLFAVLQAVASVWVIWFCFRNLRTGFALAAGLWFVVISNATAHLGGQYFQYMPVRLLFPAASLLLLSVWQRRGNAWLAFALGGVLALGVFWNLDSGIVVAVGFAAFILFSQYPQRRPLGARLRHLVMYAVGATAANLGFVVYLQLKAGMAIDPGALVYFQHAFAAEGFAMLPMPQPLSYWTAAVAVYATTLVLFAREVGYGTADAELERAAYLALIGAGLFAYFVGRSHLYVLMLCCWPAVVLLFFLLARVTSVPTSLDRWSRPAHRILPGLATGAALFVLATWMPDLAARTRLGWHTVGTSTLPSSIHDDADFIRTHSAAGAPVAVLANHQASLLAEAGRRSAVPGPGIAESLLRADADHTIAFLLDAGPRDLFVQAALLEATTQGPGFEPWIKFGFPRLQSAYEAQKVGPGGRLLHLTRR